MGRDHLDAQRFSRRSLFVGAGFAGFARLAGFAGFAGFAGLLAACDRSAGPAKSTGLFAGADGCKLTATTTQDPYYFDAGQVRGDIREDRPGRRLRLVLRLRDVTACKPIADALIEIWHCDAQGNYSGAGSAPNAGGTRIRATPSSPGATSTGTGDGGAGDDGAGDDGMTGAGTASFTPSDDQRYLRGAQVTNQDGLAEFTTIWPGWHPGRTVHVNVMVRLDTTLVLTTQLMFDEALNSKVLADPPYANHTGRDTLNQQDSVFQPAMLLKVTPETNGYLGVVSLAVKT